MSFRDFPRSICLCGSLWLAAGLSVLPGSGAPALAQQPSELVDRIVAIVGDTAILQSELQEFVFRLRAQGVQVPQDPQQLSAFMRQALNQKVNEVLLMVHAERDGITATEGEVNEEVDNRIAQVQRQFASQIEFEQALAGEGVTSAEYRIRITEQTRAEIIAQRYLQMKVSSLQPLPVSEEEVKARFEAQKASLGRKPATVTLKQVVVKASPSDDALLLAQEKAEQALSRVKAGEDFAVLAREYSDDPGSRQKGGQLGWLSQSDVVPQFGDALFSMQVGDISDLVKSIFGFHIIKLDKVRGDERSARHILVRPELTPEDTSRAHSLAEEVAAALRTGADVDSLILLYGDPAERNSLTNFPRDRLSPKYAAALQDARAGDVIGPLLMETPDVAATWIVAKLLAVNPGGEWTLEDVYDSLRLQIQQEQMLQRVIDDLRERTYIEIRFEGLPTTR